MATFEVQVEGLTSLSIDGSSAPTQDELTQFLTDGAKEIINQLPHDLKEKCMTETTLNNSSPTMDLDGVGNILYVSRLSANSGGYRVSCREVPSMHAGLTSDSSSLLYYGTVTDPVYWIQSTNDAAILNVYPTPEATQTARVYHITYPVFDADGSGSNVNIKTATSIPNFPDEAEYLVVLRAAITAAKYLLAIEEDTELYGPIIGVLKTQYQEGILALQTGSVIPKQQGKR